MKFIKSIIPDFLIIAGVSGISYGAYMVNEPYGYVTGGAFMLIIGVLMARANT